MPVGDYIVIAVVLVLIGIAVRYLIKLKKSGGCSGNCGGCSCNCGCDTKDQSHK